jgi:hypothetical protein
LNDLLDCLHDLLDVSEEDVSLKLNHIDAMSREALLEFVAISTSPACVGTYNFSGEDTTDMRAFAALNNESDAGRDTSSDDSYAA